MIFLRPASVAVIRCGNCLYSMTMTVTLMLAIQLYQVLAYPGMAVRLPRLYFYAGLLGGPPTGRISM